MNVNPKRNLKRVALSNLILGILALELALIPLLQEPEYLFGSADAFGDYRFSALGHRFWPVSLILSLLGCITAVNILSKNMREDGEKMEKHIATVGAILNALVFVAAFILFVFTPRYSYPQFSTISNTLLP